MQAHAKIILSYTVGVVKFIRLCRISIFYGDTSVGVLFFQFVQRRYQDHETNNCACMALVLVVVLQVLYPGRYTKRREDGRQDSLLIGELLAGSGGNHPTSNDRLR